MRIGPDAIAPAAYRAARAGDRSRRAGRARLALFSPFPPAVSGISDYSARLVAELSKTYVIDRYHDGDLGPEGVRDASASTSDARMFPRIAAYRDYRAILYQMGNSRFHRFLYPTLLRHPGLTTLHDFCLAGFHLDYGRRTGGLREHFAEELGHDSPEAAAEMLAALDAHPDDLDRVVASCAGRGAYLNRRVFERSRRVVVHSPWCVDRLRERAPELADKAVVIPLGATARPVPIDEKGRIRGRFAIPESAVVLSAFGFLHPAKMNAEALEAFGAVARVEPSALLLFVGEETDGGRLRRRAGEMGLADRVRFLGRRPADEFADLAAITDVGLNLRRPPTNGETSAALLDLLRHGVAAIVTDVDTFTDLPDPLVRKVGLGRDDLARAMIDLATDAPAREAMGRAAIEHVLTRHDWPRVAALYAELIEREIP